MSFIRPGWPRRWSTKEANEETTDAYVFDNGEGVEFMGRNEAMDYGDFVQVVESALKRVMSSEEAEAIASDMMENFTGEEVKPLTKEEILFGMTENVKDKRSRSED